MLTDPLRTATLSLDLDDKWSYLKVAGIEGWERFPSYLDRVVPLALESLDAAGLRCTWFLVGSDAAQSRHGADLRSIVSSGHTVGNHSMVHEPWLHLYSPERLESEIREAEEAIVGATGHRPTAFRGPGFSWSETLFEVLLARGYAFDASTLPTYLAGVARAYYAARTRLTRAQMIERKALFGSWRDGRRPLKPYRWTLQSGSTFLEIPVTTIPGIRAPFHLSYLLWLSRYSDALAMGYLHAALSACRLAGVAPSVLLHPLDFLGTDDVSGLEFFPAMELPGARKRDLVQRVLTAVKAAFPVSDLATVGTAISKLPAGAIPERAIDWRHDIPVAASANAGTQPLEAA